MSHYGQYIKERLGKEIVENDKGFATFMTWADGLYIEDLFVAPDHRHSHVATELADKIAAIAKERGFSRLYGSVVPSANYSTESIKVLLSYGMRLDSSANNFIVFKKEI